MTKEEIQLLLDQQNPQSEQALEFSSMLQFHDLGWECSYAEHEEESNSFLGREDFTEVVLDKFLLPKLEEFNPNIPKEAIKEALDVLKEDRSIKQTVNANREIYQLLKDGISVSFTDSDGNQQTERIKAIDWKRPSNNHFLIVSQFQVKGSLGLRRPDLIGFVNGLPLLFIEYKSADNNVKNAYDDNLRDYKDTIPHLLYYNAFCLLSNGLEAKVGSITAGWEHFADWKKVSAESEPGLIDLNTTINGTCQKERFLDIVANFIVFMEGSGGLAKIVSKNHQFLGVNNSIKALNSINDNDGRLGVFWHTQGSGKSVSMMFFCQKVLRTKPGNWTFVIITDRAELDKQIYKNFEAANIISSSHVQAKSVNDLRELLTQDHRYIFTLIHKFQTEDGSLHPVLSERDDIIIITDEAHRSQYDLLAQNMRNALPSASFLGFTGTPLISNEQQKTKEVFGDYVSVYNFSQSIEDGATVPLYYENRIPELQISNKNFEKEFYDIIDESMLNEDEERKLSRNFSSLYQLITREDRLDEIAKDIVHHFAGRGNRGKAMVICIDKATTVRMYDKVKHHLELYLNDLNDQISTETSQDKKDSLNDLYAFLKETDLAVVVSSGQNEVAIVEEQGGDIRPHRERMLKEDLEMKFKDSEDPFRIVFVCSMWITGFDVPSCSTIYLDKPMKNHTLMQTIARANRVFPDKHNGLIVDYAGIFNSLERALSVYGDSNVSDTPIKDKDELKSELMVVMEELLEFLTKHKVDLDRIRSELDISKRLSLFGQARDLLLVNDEVKKEFIRLGNVVKTLYKAYLPNTIEAKIAERVYLTRKLVKSIQALNPIIDIDSVLDKVEDLLDKSIESFEIKEAKDKIYDLSLIDFDLLKKRFEKEPNKRTEVEKLKNSLNNKISAMVKVNKTRINYLEKLNKMIDEYNDGAASVDEIFKKLLDLVNEIKLEETRFVKEELSDEKELAIFDLLITNPKPDLTEKEIKLVKSAARSLYDKLLTGLLVIDWRKKQSAKSKVKVNIEKVLDEGLPSSYDKTMFDDKCNTVYDYVWENM